EFGAGSGAALLHQRHLVRSPVDHVYGQFGDVVKGAANLGECGSDVEEALLNLSGEVALADQRSVGVPGDLPGHEHELGAGSNRYLAEKVDLWQAMRVRQSDGHEGLLIVRAVRPRL